MLGEVCRVSDINVVRLVGMFNILKSYVGVFLSLYLCTTKSHHARMIFIMVLHE